jgi:hypothetical protein
VEVRVNDALPEGWLPIPFGVEDAEVAGLAAELTRVAAETMPGFMDGDEARSAMAAAISRPPLTADVLGRVWHVLGPAATGAVADLSIAGATASVPDSPLALSVPQRTVRFADGRAVLSLVAPRENVHVAMLLRAQRRDGERTLVADVIDTAAVLGLVLDDVISLVGGEPPAQTAESAS